jgi:hypothetical protein
MLPSNTVPLEPLHYRTARARCSELDYRSLLWLVCSREFSENRGVVLQLLLPFSPSSINCTPAAVPYPVQATG